MKQLGFWLLVSAFINAAVSPEVFGFSAAEYSAPTPVHAAPSADEDTARYWLEIERLTREVEREKIELSRVKSELAAANKRVDACSKPGRPIEKKQAVK